MRAAAMQVAAAKAAPARPICSSRLHLLGTRAGGTVGGYGKTNEGKIIAAALLDNFNNVVEVVPRRYQPAAKRRHAAR